MSRIFKTPFASSGDKNTVPAAVQGDGSLSVAQGWGPDYEKAYGDPASKDIKRADMNGLLHDITEAIGEMQAQGVATWSTDGKPYAKGVLVYHASKLWQSTVATNNATPGTTGWIEVSIADLATAASAKTFGAGLDDVAGVVTVKYGTTAGTAAQGNDSRIAGAALKANNLSDLANASTARANLGLGDAAQKAVTSSTTDTTAGRLVKVGDYGLGLPVPLTGSDNLNNVHVSGLYRWGASGAPANAPAGVTAATMYVSSWAGDANSIAQMVISSTGGLTVRAKPNSGGSWSSWSTMPNAAWRVLAGTGLLGGGDMSVDRTISANFGTTAGTIAQGNDSRIVGAALKANNLSDLTNLAAARNNLGVNSTLSKGASGYWRDATTGLTLQWGKTPTGLNFRTITFPITFPEQVVTVQLTPLKNDGTNEYAPRVMTLTNSGCTITSQHSDSASQWLAVGY